MVLTILFYCFVMQSVFFGELLLEDHVPLFTLAIAFAANLILLVLLKMRFDFDRKRWLS